MQVYVALSAMLTWAMTDDEVDLSSMYDVLRQQFQNPDDPWVKETLQWWDGYVLTPPHQTSHPFMVYHSSQVFPTPANEGEDPDNLRDTEGPTVRELMEMERAARISQ